MKIPNKIRIGGQDINIINKDRLEGDILGDICIAEGALRIADNFRSCKQSDSSKVNTFIHEVIHGVLDSMGESVLSKNEKFVCTFTSLLIDPIEEIVKVNNEHTAMMLGDINTPLSNTNKREVEDLED